MPHPLNHLHSHVIANLERAGAFLFGFDLSRRVKEAEE